MSRPGGLGRGLGALIPQGGPETSGLLTLARSAVVPNARQPREGFDEHLLLELAASLSEVGMLQPILVRPRPDGRYEIVAGERRFRAAGLAGMDTVPALVRHTEDAQLLTEALVENLHRADLTPLEEAAAYEQLLGDFGMTHEALAAKLGKSRSAITNALRLLSLPAAVQSQVASGALSAGHARALLTAPEALRERLAQRVVMEGLSVRATEALARARLESESTAGRPTKRIRERAGQYADLERRLEDALATRVRITGSERRGRVLIEYAGREDLDRVLDILGRGSGTSLVAE